jgi:hypothetical protein
VKISRVDRRPLPRRDSRLKSGLVLYVTCVLRGVGLGSRADFRPSPRCLQGAVRVPSPYRLPATSTWCLGSSTSLHLNKQSTHAISMA